MRGKSALFCYNIPNAFPASDKGCINKKGDTQMTAIHGKGLPGWVELAADDTKAALKFYEALFGWKSLSTGDEKFEYHILQNGDRTIGGLSGKMNPGQPTAWQVYLETDKIDATIEDVKANGGAVYMPATPMPGGQFTFASDPANAPLGIMESEKVNDSFGEENGLMWYELHTSGEIEQVVSFYEKTFGWSAKTEVESPEMTYVTFGPDSERQVGGVFASPETQQSQWYVVFKSSDIDAFAEKAKGLGATIQTLQKGTPYGDFAMIQDPQGAVFTIMNPSGVSA